MSRLRRLQQRSASEGRTPLLLVDDVHAAREPRGIRPRTPANASEHVEASAARLLQLVAYRPRIPEHELAALHTAVVAAVSRTQFVSPNTDRTRLSVLYRYATWVLHNEGQFDNTKLDDLRLHTYRQQGCAALRPTSRDTAFSILRTIRYAAPAESTHRMTRIAVTTPYDDSDWFAYRNAADQLAGTTWHTDALMLLDLSGELGLRSSEINAITGRNLEMLTDGVRIAPPGANRRDLVATGRLAGRLRPWIGTEAHLLRPQYSKRGNTANFVAERLAHHNQAFGGFQIRRARHRWIVKLMTAPIPTVTVLELAGLRSDNHTLTDLARHIRDSGHHVDPTAQVFPGS